MLILKNILLYGFELGYLNAALYSCFSFAEYYRDEFD